MASTLKKSTLYNILFIMCVGVTYLNNYELTFAVWCVSFALTLSTVYSVVFLKQVFCFIGILAIAMVTTLFHDNILYYVIRDITYLMKPILGLFIGYQICKRLGVNPFRMIVNTGVIIAIIHFLLIFYAILVLHVGTMNEIRISSGFFSDFEVYALIILLFKERFELELSRQKTILFAVVIGMSALFYFARINFIQFGILFIAMKGYLKLNKRSILVVTSVILLSVIGYWTVVYINPKRNGKGIETMLYKIKIAPEEAFKTRIRKDDWRDFNDNYRSYENIMTVRQVTDKGTTTILFGEGLGSRIDLKKTVWLGDIKQRYISILHNGYMTVFLKSGLFGILLLCASIVILFKRPKSDIPIIRQINLLFVGSGVFMIASYWVFMGYYFAADSKAILFGFLICYREMVIKREAISVQND